MPAPSTPAPVEAATLRAAAQGGTLTITDAAQRPLLVACHARATLTDGTTYTTAGASARATATGLLLEATPATLTVRPEGSVRLRWSITPTSAGLALRLEVENAGPTPLALERLDPLVVPSGVAGAPLADLELLQAGYQSWTFATPAVPAAQHRSGPYPTIAGPLLPASEAERFLSPWATLVRAPGQQPLVVGFTSARDWLGTVAVQAAIAGHRLTASNWLEGRTIAPGEVVRSERLLLTTAPADHAALAAYARAAAADMGARTRTHAPTGWCSWYYYFEGVSEAAMLRNLDVLTAERRRVPIDVVQLDDGYQTAIGDWLSLNAKFPGGMRTLTDRIHAAGFEAGIWLAPFLVAENSAVFHDHPDWVLRDRAGEPVPAIFNWQVRCFALDLTHPGVLTHLREVIRTIVEDWGYDYLKIDFIYAGALRGEHHDRQATGVQAYRRGLALIREAAGERFVLGCGAPFLCSVGLVDGMRVSPDTAPDWEHPDGTGASPALINAIRSTLAHHWMHPHWWTNDPDCLIVREADSRLSEAEVHTWATVVALSGGMVLLSDDLGSLEPARAAIIPRCLPPLGVAARPLGPAHDGLPTRLYLPAEHGGRQTYLAAVFNWQAAPASSTFNPAEWPGAPTCPYWLLDLWTGEAHGPLAGPVDLGVTPSHGVRLLALAAALERPHLIGSTLTLTGGALEIAGETWEAHTLTIALRCPGDHAGELVIAVPAGWIPIDEPADAGVLRIALTLRDEAEIALAFREVHHASPSPP